MRPGLFLAGLLTLSNVAHAGPPTEAELVDTLLNNPSKGKKVKAAETLRDSRMTGATPALRQACAVGADDWVCEKAISALEAFRTPEASAALEQILLDDAATTYVRIKALNALERLDRARLASIAPIALQRYRSLDPNLVTQLVKALVDGNNRSAMDFTVLIASDMAAARRSRVVALEGAEAFKHPRLFDAYLTLVEDSDKKLQIKAIEGLGAGGYPAGLVTDPLVKVAWHDTRGDVRAAAMKALRKYASPALVPLLNHAVVNETHLASAVHAYAMFVPLADATSVPAIQTLLRREGLPDETYVDLIHAAVRIFDPAVVPQLETLVTTTESEVVRAEAQRALDLFRGPPEQQVVYVQSIPIVDVVLVDLSVPVVMPPPLTVSINASGVVDWAGGVQVQATIGQ